MELHAGVQILNKEVAVEPKLAINDVKNEVPPLHASRTSLDKKQSPRIVILKAVCRFIVLLINKVCGFSIFAAGFPLLLATLLIIVSFSSTLHGAIEIKNKRVCNGLLFPGNLDPSSLTPGGPVVLLVCGFRRRDKLSAWHELFANLHQLQSRI